MDKSCPSGTSSLGQSEIHPRTSDSLRQTNTGRVLSESTPSTHTHRVSSAPPGPTELALVAPVDAMGHTTVRRDIGGQK